MARAWVNQRSGLLLNFFITGVSGELVRRSLRRQRRTAGKPAGYTVLKEVLNEEWQGRINECCVRESFSFFWVGILLKVLGDGLPSEALNHAALE